MEKWKAPRAQPPAPDNTAATAQLLASLLRDGAWAVETVEYKNGALIAARCRRLRKDEAPGQLSVSQVNERGVIETTHYPGGEG